MKNKRFKRETAWLVVGTLMVSTMLAGCSKKNVDYISMVAAEIRTVEAFRINMIFRSHMMEVLRSEIQGLMISP